LEEDPESEAIPLVSTDEAIDMLEGLCLHEISTGGRSHGGDSGVAKAQAGTQVEEGQ
jgi:hypothetical protein